MTALPRRFYVGEYAAHEAGRKSTLRSALAEAACMTALERNGDVVHLSSYAPLLAKQRHTQWRPGLIYFDNTTVSPTINYYVQQLFSANAGDAYLPTTVKFDADDKTIAASCVRDVKSGDPAAETPFGQPPAVLPKASGLAVGQKFAYEVPAHSLSVIRMKTQKP
jgi:alpha-N-arabinofuranosidase